MSEYILIGNWPKKAKPAEILAEVRQKYGDAKVLAHPDCKGLDGVVVPSYGYPPPRHFMVACGADSVERREEVMVQRREVPASGGGEGIFDE